MTVKPECEIDWVYGNRRLTVLYEVMHDEIFIQRLGVYQETVLCLEIFSARGRQFHLVIQVSDGHRENRFLESFTQRHIFSHTISFHLERDHFTHILKVISEIDVFIQRQFYQEMERFT